MQVLTASGGKNDGLDGLPLLAFAPPGEAIKVRNQSVRETDFKRGKWPGRSRLRLFSSKLAAPDGCQVKASFDG